MKPTPPCLDCPDRQIGCHAVCEAYKAFRSALDGYNETAEGGDVVQAVENEISIALEAIINVSVD